MSVYIEKKNSKFYVKNFWFEFCFKIWKKKKTTLKIKSSISCCYFQAKQFTMQCLSDSCKIYLLWFYWASLMAQSGRVCLQCRRPGFDPWVRKIPCRRKWQPTPVFLPGESYRQRTGWISLQSKGLSRVFSNTTVQKHQFFGAQLSSQSNSHIHTWPLEKPQPWLDGPLLAK